MGSTLILVTSDTGAGHLKQGKRADRVQSFTHRLVDGPVPAGGAPETFFPRRRVLFEADRLFHEPFWFTPDDEPVSEAFSTRPRRTTLSRPLWRTLPALCRNFERVELWIDPDPNAQLVMLQLLDWLGTLPDLVPRLFIKHSEQPLGERRAGDWIVAPIAVQPADLALAARAWGAFTAATPEAWQVLRKDRDIGRFPGLATCIEHTLTELPGPDGLGRTARLILSLVEHHHHWRPTDGGDQRTLAEEERSLSGLMRRVVQAAPRTPLWFFEIGALICDLAAAPVPALEGVPEAHFDLAVHMDEARRRRLYGSRIALTPFGRELLGGRTDWAGHNPVRRWVGGTRLANDSLWRWDATSGRIVPPPPRR